MSIDPETLTVYGAKAAEYADMTQGEAENRFLSTFIAALPEGARALDLGCGPGHSAAAMARAGIAVDAIDAVPEMVAMAQAHDGVTAWQASFDEITGEALYDGIWANFALLHAPKADMPRHLAVLVKSLKPGGLFHIGMKTGKGEIRDTIGRLYAYYTEDELHGLLSDAGLSPGESWTGEERGLDGAMAPWVVIHAHG
ncbi:class I SAM-dependent methyltransferase [Roseovarius sp. LXJ103]|uniref:class I SAM-dependent methyltransferase n=1 Tax=Roseovarius carneus TaxID=2853164 RepID=UPI000D60BD21|nr:class I SAM-dependent methyltransferase [Roseovarius carneus]MBZ8117293.1 class I SAM-dependent methyltransferase [Roseovarius carneus]PWE36882.1 SAM-dependent methyltransferase [Pelagicola sp. LXJ1103]